MVENTEQEVEAAEEIIKKDYSVPVEKTSKKVFSDIEGVKIYNIPTVQRNMENGEMIPGRLYDYEGKTRNEEGVFYNIGIGFVLKDEHIIIQ